MPAPFERTSVPGVYRRGRRYVVTYRDPSGRQRKRSAGTLAEARRLKSELAADVARGEYREQSQIRFDAYAREWIAGYQGRTSRGIRPRTLQDYRRSLERIAIPHFGGMRLGEIESRHVKALLGGLSDCGVAPLTLRNALTPLRVLPRRR